MRWRAVALAAAAILTITIGPAASADHAPKKIVVPSKQKVARAQQRVADTKQSVATIEAELAAAGRELQRLEVAAGRAAEAYDGAVMTWREDRRAAVQARHRALKAASNQRVARAELAGYLVTAANSGQNMDMFSTALTSGGSQRLLTQISQLDTSAGFLESQRQTWLASSQLAKVYRAAAVKALKTAHAAKIAANEAKLAAEAAAARQQAAVASIDARRQDLLVELAHARHVSVALATQRQIGLEERRQRRLARERRERMLARQRREERQQRREERRQARQERRREDHDGGQPTPPPVADPPGPAHGAKAAVAFAYKQVGEPYVYGAAGPNSWDCSGLTMKAWAHAGVSLPHWSVDQYYASTPITSSELKPGDLVFWADDNSDPDTIFHVGLYIGGGDEIAAPYPGAYVRVESIWDWRTPSFFARP